MKYSLRLLNADEMSVLSKRKWKISSYAYYMSRDIIDEDDFTILLNEGMAYSTKSQFLDYTKKKRVVLPCLDDPDLEQLKNIPETIMLGEYPQERVSTYTSYLLEEHYQNHRLEATGFSYATPELNQSRDDQNTKLNRAVVYYFQGEKYIRSTLPFNMFMTNKAYNDFVVDWKSPVWYKVSPVEWIVDQKRKLLVSRYGLASGFSPKQALSFVPTSMTNDMFASLILEEAKSEELEKRASSIDEDLAFIKERLKLSYGASPELKDLLYPALERTDQVAYKIKNSYQKIK